MTRTIAALLVLPLLAASPQDTRKKGKWHDMDYGPFFSTSVSLQWPEKTITQKGIVVRVSRKPEAAMCFDTDLLRCSGAWTGGFLNLMGPTHDGTKKPLYKSFPSIWGEQRFGTRPGPGWAVDGDFSDPRPEPYGPLPARRARWNGLYVHGERVVLSYTVGSTPILELPGFMSRDDVWGFTRTFWMGKSEKPLTLVVAESDNAPGGVGHVRDPKPTKPKGPVNRMSAVMGDVIAGLAGGTSGIFPPGAEWEVSKGRLLLRFPPQTAPTLFMLVVGPSAEKDRPYFATFLRAGYENPRDYLKGGPARYPKKLLTRGRKGRGFGPYAVDEIVAPERNPWNSWMRFGGLDFYEDGRAAISTWSGDIWTVSGLNEPLDRIVWKRYATGLHQPLGLKIVDGVLYATCRDQITRFHDFNGDGEADFYENFNNDCAVTRNYHEYAMGLHTDREGNFYYMKGAPSFAPEKNPPITRHHGCLIKVSKDGKSSEILATGVRASNGLGVGPNGEIIVNDNDGHWGPSTRLNFVKKGGYYGDPVTAQRTPVPEIYEPPLCWIPKKADNSSGGAIWVDSDRWGPFKGRMLHTSYGTCSLFLAFMEKAGDDMQGGVVRFPLEFSSGIMRPRFNPVDGQLYVCGLRGWGSKAPREGVFNRVRYTGGKVHMVSDLRVTSTGVDITFTNPLDPESATNPEYYAVEWWQYRYTKSYGSADYSVNDPKKGGRDDVPVKSIKLSKDGKTVSLEIPGIRPVMQMGIRLRVRAADGTRIRQEIYNTINSVP